MVTGRTFAIGDIHGDLAALDKLLSRLPELTAEDTIVFLGDYLDRGPHSKEVVQIVMGLDKDVGCNVVCLRGNHEDAWLRVRARRWDEFVFPPQNGCLATYRSFTGGKNEPSSIASSSSASGSCSGSGTGRPLYEQYAS